MIRLPRGFLHLLTQKIKRGDFFGALFIGVKLNIIANRICWPKSMNAARDQQVLRDDVIKKCLRIIEQFARLFANLGIVENRRITAAQLPRMKEGGPIDERNQIPDHGSTYARAKELWSRRNIAAPIDRSPIRARFIERQQILFPRLCRMLLTQP